MKYIFIHIPKTAGSLIKTLIKISPKTPNIIVYHIDDKPDLLEHYRISEIKKSFFVKDLNYFSIVRNPYDRIFSMWKFLKFRNGNIKLLPKVEENFYDFLVSLKNKEYNCNFFYSQSTFLDDDSEKITSIKYEEKDKIKNFLEENNIRWMDKKINNSLGIYYKDAYVSDLHTSIIKELYEEDFKRFNYKFEL
jgi:hypothetical protein